MAGFLHSGLAYGHITMPAYPARKCNHPGCTALSRDGSGRCPDHTRKAWQHQDNASSSARGYGYRWQKLRLQVLARDSGLCQCPDCLGGAKRVTPATEVDHIVSKAKAKQLGWTQSQVDAMDNLRGVSHACHVKITQLEQGRTPRQVASFGQDGRVIW